MDQVDTRLNFLEEQHEAIVMQNRVLATAFKSLLRSLPADMSEQVVESIQQGFEDELGQLQYENHPQVDLFHDATYQFFHEREH